MEKLTFNTTIDASRQQVWNVLFGEVTYPQWTSVFAEGSMVETDWQEGSKALFLDGNGNGMVSTVVRSIPNEFLSIRHIGELRDGKEDLDSERVSKWAGALENYVLSDSGGFTELRIEADVTEEFKAYFLDAWPKALEKVKEMAEKQNQPA